MVRVTIWILLEVTAGILAFGGFVGLSVLGVRHAEEVPAAAFASASTRAYQH
jgi:hypothetical protein